MVQYWLRHFATFAVLGFALLLVAELLKGRGWETGLVNAGVWGVVVGAVVASTKAYKTRKGEACAVCADEEVAG